MLEILSAMQLFNQKVYDNIRNISDSVQLQYKTALPFPFIEIDNLWNNDFLSQISREIGCIKDWDGEKYFFGSIGKRWVVTPEKLPRHCRQFIEYLNSSQICGLVESITGEKHLIPDPYLDGGGIHSTKRNGFLKMHADFNWHHKLQCYRRINLLIYLNKSWKEEWEGHLLFATKNDSGYIDVKNKITPSFNKTVIFTTTDHTYHGHPSPLNTPDNITRDSIAMYYYQSTKPDGSAELKRTDTDYKLSKSDLIGMPSDIASRLKPISQN